MLSTLSINSILSLLVVGLWRACATNPLSFVDGQMKRSIFVVLETQLTRIMYFLFSTPNRIAGRILRSLDVGTNVSEKQKSADLKNEVTLKPK